MFDTQNTIIIFSIREVQKKSRYAKSIVSALNNLKGPIKEMRIANKGDDENGLQHGQTWGRLTGSIYIFLNVVQHTETVLIQETRQTLIVWFWRIVLETVRKPLGSED